MSSGRQIAGAKTHAAIVATQLSLNGLRQIAIDVEQAAREVANTDERTELDIMATAYREEIARREAQ